MTKIAALGAPTLIGLGLSVAGSLASLAAQRSHVKKQEAANRAWMDYQRRKTDTFERQDEENRKKAQDALNENLDKSGIENREQVIADEETRLADVFGENNLANITAELVGSGQGGGTSQVFDNEMARQLGKATEDARQRIKAMARSTAYGGGSQGSMLMQDMLRNVDTQSILGGINDNRRGDIRTLRKYQEVEPEIFQYSGSPLASALSAAGSVVGGFGGGPMAGAVAPAASSTSFLKPTPMASPYSYFGPSGGWRPNVMGPG